MRIVSRHPYLTGAVAAVLLYVALTLRVRFPFMADDYAHLAAARGLTHPFSDYFSAWLIRFPVSTLAGYTLLGTGVLERTWAPMYLVFAVHAASIALVARWLVHTLAGRSEAQAPHPGVLAAAVAVAALYPDVYEILYWPSCMPFVLGGLFLAAALYARPVVAAVLAALSFLTYESYVLPLAALMTVPVLVAAAPTTRAWWRELWRRGWPWLAGVGLTLAIRAAASLGRGGSYDHHVSFAPLRIADKALTAAKQLFQLRFWGTGSNTWATGAFVMALLLACVMLWRSRHWRREPATLIGLCFLSTAAYWILAYNAMRAIYGSQLMLCAVFVWLANQVLRAGVRAAVVAGAALLVGAGFVTQSMRIWRVKDHNAVIIAEFEASLAQKMQGCASPCVIEYEDVTARLEKDWVLPPDYTDAYLTYVRHRHGQGQEIRFVPAGAVPR